jgi:Mg2+-importing ATPase
MNQKNLSGFNMDKKYINSSAEEVLKILEVSFEKGLSHREVEERILKYGRNLLIEKEKTNILKKILQKFLSPLVIILLCAGLLSSFFGEKIDVIIIFSIVFLSVVLDFFQEYKSEKAAKKLKEKVITKVEVFRNSRKELIKIKNIVPGDIIFLSVGSIVPADARVIFSDDFFVNESSLTGEAYPVSKNNQPLKDFSSSIDEQKNIVFMGTSVSSGYAKAVVVNTGVKTVFGRITENLQEKRQSTEFENGIKSFGFLITKIVLVLVLTIFLINLFTKGFEASNVLNSLMFSLALAVGLTPELLPMIVSITLANGSMKMSKKGVIVKRLNSIHDLGGMDVLCTDKTGTLTENNIVLVKHIDLDGNTSDKLLEYAVINSTFQSGIENPLDEAILKIGDSMGAESFAKIDEIPFDFSRRRLSVVVEKNKERLLVGKGAPEEVFKVCSFYEENGILKNFDNEILEKAQNKNKELSSEGFRVLALAYKKIDYEKDNYVVEDEKDLVLLGLIAFLDPVKKNIRESIDLLEEQGIEIKVITGDNDLVSKKICEDAGVEVKGILDGSKIDGLDDKQLKDIVEKITIFSRISPEQKARIVLAIRSNGHCVGYMGDGINDALPLKSADVGISVNNAVDVAKETADLILLTKNLHVLSLGVDIGRKTFGNTLKYVLMGLSSNFGNMFSLVGAAIFLPFLPMLPIQILLNNLLYDFSQITIPADNVDKEYTKKPKRWDIKAIKKFMFTFGPISSLFDFAIFGLLYFVFRNFTNFESLFQTGWFLESLLTQVLVIFIIRTRRSPFFKSKPSKYLILSTFFVLTIAFIIPFTIFGKFFHFAVPDFTMIALVSIISVVYLITVDFCKRIIYKKYFL